jgi:hypothetical protein
MFHVKRSRPTSCHRACLAFRSDLARSAEIFLLDELREFGASSYAKERA